MERPGLAGAIGCVSATVALLALTGLLDASLVDIALAILAVRCAAAALSREPSALASAAAAALPLAALVVVGGMRAGSISLDAVRSANAVLGPAALTRPLMFAVATLLVVAAVVLSTPPVAGSNRFVRMLELSSVAATSLLVATLVGGPSLDRVAVVPIWSGLTVLALGVIVATRTSSAIPRMRVVVAGLALAATALAVAA